MARDALTPENARRYWQETSRLMWIVLAIWFLLGLGLHAFSDTLNKVVILGFPLGFYLAAQGALIGFVVVIFWYTRRQNAIDEDFNLSED
jgi:putative solute:sodium symporter small subunit